MKIDNNIQLLKSVDELEGKTISKIISQEDGEELLFKFSDNTCAIIKAIQYGEYSEFEFQYEKYNLTDQILLALGYITQTEYDIREKAKKLDSKKRNIEYLKNNIKILKQQLKKTETEELN